MKPVITRIGFKRQNGRPCMCTVLCHRIAFSFFRPETASMWNTTPLNNGLQRSCRMWRRGFDCLTGVDSGAIRAITIAITTASIIPIRSTGRNNRSAMWPFSISISPPGESPRNKLDADSRSLRPPFVCDRIEIDYRVNERNPVGFAAG